MRWVKAGLTGSRRESRGAILAVWLVTFGLISIHGACSTRSVGGPPSSAAPGTHGGAPNQGATAAGEDAAPPTSFVPERVQGDGTAMGTHLAFAAYTTATVDARGAAEAFTRAIAEIRRIEALMTTWRPESEISRVNSAAGKAAVAVSDETVEVLRESLRASALSDGAFDVTFETLHGLWKFDEDLDPHPPSEQAIKARIPFVGYRHVRLNEAQKTVMLTRPETRIGLGGIAKGYAVDRAARVLSEAGLTSFFVQAGGDLLARGRKPDGGEWQAGIRDPRGAEGVYFAKLPISDRAFSTAGDYERSYIVGGKRYHHILDPRTGSPAAGCRSVTIWAQTAFLADAIDDAVFVLGPEQGLRLVESLDDVGAVIVDAKNNLWVSKRLRGKLQLVSAPTDGT